MLAGSLGLERATSFPPAAGKSQHWNVFASPTKQKPSTKRSRNVGETCERVNSTAFEQRRTKKQMIATAPPTLGRLKMQALLQREQEILKAKDESPYPTPVEETSQSLLLKSFHRTQSLSNSPKPHFLSNFGTANDAVIQHQTRRSPPELMSLSYFYLYLDLVGDVREMERFQLARFSRMEGDECEPAHVNSICRDRFPRVQELCDRGLPNNGLMMVKINLNLHHLRTGDFRNVSVFETTRARTIECTTTVYHFGQRILETKEIQYPVRNGEGKAPDDVHSSSTQMPSSGEPYPDPSAINEEERVNMTLHPSTDSIPSLLDPIAALSLAGEDPADQQHLQDLAAAYPDPFMGTPFAQLLAESATLAQDPSSSSSSVFPSFLSSTTPSNGSPAMPSSWSPQSSTSSNSGANGARHIYHFDFVRQFFSAFLAGFQCLKLDVEKMIAIDNLSVMQVFEDLSLPFDQGGAAAPLLCVCYQFECGRGDTKGYMIDGYRRSC